MDTSLIQHRLATKQDNDFIYACWLSSERQQLPTSLTPNVLYDKEQRKKINYILSHSQTMLSFFMDDENKEVLTSFLTYQFQQDTLLVHYAFTKSPYRRMGIQSGTLNLINIPKFPVVLTCQPPQTILKGHPDMIYDAFYFQRTSYAT